MSIALAVKYRPKEFEECCSQKALIKIYLIFAQKSY